MKVKLEVNKIFSFAVGLEQEGRQKNTIFCSGNIVYILNADKTVLMRLISPEEFKTPIGFFANDYESDKFSIQDDAIVFTTREEDEDARFERKKYCRAPTENFEDADAIYKKFWVDDYIATMTFRADSLKLLESSLSHIEFVSKDKKPMILQRDIYSGSVIKLSPITKGMGFASEGEEFKEDFGPLGMRTSDFFTLFAFDDEIRLYFLPLEKKYFIAKGGNNDWVAIISGCLYDEVGEIYKQTTKENEDGWKEQEDGANVEKAGGTAQKKTSACRKRAQ
jgi:hypothetical protein